MPAPNSTFIISPHRQSKDLPNLNCYALKASVHMFTQYALSYRPAAQPVSGRNSYCFIKTYLLQRIYYKYLLQNILILALFTVN